MKSHVGTLVDTMKDSIAYMVCGLQLILVINGDLFSMPPLFLLYTPQLVTQNYLSKEVSSIVTVHYSVIHIIGFATCNYRKVACAYLLLNGNINE